MLKVLIGPSGPGHPLCIDCYLWPFIRLPGGVGNLTAGGLYYNYLAHLIKLLHRKESKAGKVSKCNETSKLRAKGN